MKYTIWSRIHLVSEDRPMLWTRSVATFRVDSYQSTWYDLFIEILRMVAMDYCFQKTCLRLDIEPAIL